MKRLVASLFIALGCTLPLIGEDAPAKSSEEAPDIGKLSQAMGHLLGRDMERLGLTLNIDHLVKGLQDFASGASAPMSEEECTHALAEVHEKVFKEQAAGNLQAALEFMERNAKEEQVVVLKEGLLQYKIDKEGAGEVVKEHSTPMIRFVGKFLNGRVFGSSQEEEPYSLDEVIPGLREGMVGMKEGEKRTIFIHPELGYGAHAGVMPPNSMLTFEVEVIRAEFEAKQEEEQSHSEIVAPQIKTEHMR